MIVFSQALALSPDEDEPLTHPALGWHNIATDENTTTTTETEANPARNLHNVSTNLYWAGVADSPEIDEYITVTIAEIVEIDYVAVARHNFGSEQITVSVEGFYADESPQQWVEIVEETLFADDAPIILRFTPQTLAGVRLRLQPGTSPPVAAVLYVGKLLVFEQGVQGDYTPIPFGRIANVVNGRSERGDFMGRIIVGAHTESGARFANLTPAWVREYLDPFLEVCHERPFFFAWSPDAYPQEVGFAWLENDPQPAFNIDGYTAIEFQMTGIVE